jgi:hypothetical protein
MKKYQDMENAQQIGLNAPQFPGQQVKGMNIEQIRTLIKKQNRIKGYSFSVVSGTNNFNLQLSGTARILLGLALIPRTLTGAPLTGFQTINTVSLKVNNEIVIENLDPNFLAQFFQNDEYYYLPRPLSGTDEITITFTNPGATELASLAIYYI